MLEEELMQSEQPMTEYEIYSYEAFKRRTHDELQTVDIAAMKNLSKDNLTELMLLSEYPQEFFLQLSVTAMVVHGKEIGELADKFGFEAPTYFIKTYIAPLLLDGKIKMTMPDKPKSKFQKYYS